MDIQYYGGNAITITTKKTRVVIDDTLSELGGKSITKDNDIALFTTDPAKKPAAHLVFSQPGEYEAAGVSIQGIQARGHMDEAGTYSATMFKILIDDVRILVVGHAYPELSERQLERIGMADVIIVPVGGNGYTIDPVGALKIVKAIEPKIVIPVHYDDGETKYPVTQQPLEQALTTMSMEASETVEKLKLKQSDVAEGGMRLVVLSKSK